MKKTTLAIAVLAVWVSALYAEDLHSEPSKNDSGERGKSAAKDNKAEYDRFIVDPIGSSLSLAGLNKDIAMRSMMNLGVTSNTTLYAVQDSLDHIKNENVYGKFANSLMLKIIREELSKERQRIQDLHKEITRIVEEADAKEKAREIAKANAAKPSDSTIKRLADIYSNMPPKSAAAIMDKLDLKVIISLYNFIPPKKMSLILGSMNPDKAMSVTSVISGNQKLPEH